MIIVENLSFSYTKSPFISDMSFSVSEGEIFGFLGPSGAGKSTLQKILIGIIRTYQGTCLINGIECKKRTKQFYENIGVDFEFSTIKAKGKTILLTTHNMQDAAELCDRVAFIVNGRICALDSPHNLIMSKGASTVTYTWFEDGEHSASCPMGQLSSDERLKSLIAANRLQSIHSSEPTLNDIFVDITGRTLL